NALLGEPLAREEVMDLAVRAEGHPDNLAAALYGGLTVTCWDGDARAVVPLPVPAGLGFALLVPDLGASTVEAPAALPPADSRADAVFNLGRAALLVAALGSQRWEVLDVAMRDRLHQPYRARALFPWLDRVFAAAREAGALGVALSGSGPSVLRLARRPEAPAVARAMKDALTAAGLVGRDLVLAVDRTGAQVEPVAGRGSACAVAPDR